MQKSPWSYRQKNGVFFFIRNQAWKKKCSSLKELSTSELTCDPETKLHTSLSKLSPTKQKQIQANLKSVSGLFCWNGSVQGDVHQHPLIWVLPRGML